MTTNTTVVGDGGRKPLPLLGAVALEDALAASLSRSRPAHVAKE